MAYCCFIIHYYVILQVVCYPRSGSGPEAPRATRLGENGPVAVQHEGWMGRFIESCIGNSRGSLMSFERDWLGFHEDFGFWRY